MATSNSQFDKLGMRLKAAAPSPADMRLLDEYRKSFGSAHELVFDTVSSLLRDQHFLAEPTRRRAKSTASIVGKLRRESTLKLTQMQDIAGCRVILHDLREQNMFIELLVKGEGGLPPVYPSAKIFDRRDKPSNGYRAVHLVVKVESKPVEIQIRTETQDMWAELSEKTSDKLGIGIKYGTGDESALATLHCLSQFVGIEKKVVEADWDLKSQARFYSLRGEFLEATRRMVMDIGAVSGDNAHEVVRGIFAGGLERAQNLLAGILDMLPGPESKSGK